jgi:hypothetical protein
MQVDWGTPPDMEIAVTMARQVKTPKSFMQDKTLVDEFGTEFADLFNVADHVKVEYETVGIPTEIFVRAPEQMPKIEFDVENMPKIKVDVSDVVFKDIKIFGPDIPIPTDIQIHGPEKAIPHEIAVINRGVPETIEVKWAEDMPRHLDVNVTTDFPERILVEQVKPFSLDVSNLENLTLKVEPVIIELKAPEGIQLLPPTSMPPVEMVYNGGPIEMKVVPVEFKVSLAESIIAQSEDGKKNCVMIVPCQG